ncbi:HAD-IB family phosphatase [Streptomyces sp. NBC_01808]|uniref:HAD family hydrolase n=1 Tax=Streptomyces sp. NBC_01808 TaxID=2975947 RepID=UPI002DD94230|nr:HAD-IB family phosphatase [Streptomyces sp. NBC_01808]WSA39005.1 HAD-IB family phosphatase [Streptomyces sp. NBC_01808]
MSRLHIFDMDGTLLHGSSANIEMARQLGLVAEFQALDAAFGAGEIDTYDYAEHAHGMWSSLTPEILGRAFAGAPWLAGIREVWADITDRGEHCAVISLAPGFFVERLLEWGVHAAHGSRFPALPFREPVDMAGILGPPDKVRIADLLCAEYGLTRADCVAYGDSMSDTDLFAVVPRSVAVNADHHVSGLASHAYSGRDLREAYALTRTGG